jgi:hypothetical protein
MTMIRQAQFPDNTERLAALHRQYSEQRFTGCLVRSNEYWNESISQELQGSLWVLLQEGVIVSWLSLRPTRGGLGIFQLQEFGVDESTIPTFQALGTLLSHAIQQQQEVEDTTTTTTTTLTTTLVLPTAVLDQIRQPDQMLSLLFDWSSETSEDDLGWMYKSLKDENTDIIEAIVIHEKEKPHLIWPSDSF